MLLVEATPSGEHYFSRKPDADFLLLRGLTTLRPLEPFLKKFAHSTTLVTTEVLSVGL